MGDGMTVCPLRPMRLPVKSSSTVPTLGLEANGSYWARGGDSLGLGLAGWCTSDATAPTSSPIQQTPAL